MSKTHESTRAAAERVVSRLLDGRLSEYHSSDDYASRPGGPSDPYRQATIPVNRASLDYSGQRGPVSPFGTRTNATDLEPGWDGAGPDPALAGDGTGLEDEDLAPGAPPQPPGPVATPPNPGRHGARFHMRFPESRGSATCVPAKTYKKTKAPKGATVAGKPGKVSYKEALMRSVLEKLKMKRQGKGTPVAGKPGKIKYTGEAKGAVKGVPTGVKKKVGTVAKAPGKIKFGKR